MMKAIVTSLSGCCRMQHTPALRRPISTIAVALLITVFIGCGGGGSSGSTDTTPPTFAGVKSVSPMASSITLGWSPASDNVTAAMDIVYLIYRSSTSGGENYTLPAYAATARGALSYSDPTVLASGATLYYVVRAMDAAGNIDSNTHELSTDTVPPTFPSGAATSATANADVSITVNWNAATDNITPQSGIAYLIYRSTTTTMNYTTPVATTAPGVTSYIDKGLTPATPYYYVVRAQDQAGNIDSNTTQVTATTPADTTAPTFGGATGAAAQSSSSITVSWTAATDNVTTSANMVYLVYRSTTTSINYNTQLVATTAAGATSYSDFGLTASTTYYYVVRAKDQAGNTDTNAVQVSAATTALVADTTPPTFAGLSSLTVQAGTSITLGWSAASDNVTAPSQIVYLIYRATTSGGEQYYPTAPTFTTAVGATSYVDTTATGAKYYYVVRAKDAAGNIDSNTVEMFGPVSFLNDIYTPLMSSSAPKPCGASGCHATATISNGGLAISSSSTAYTNLTTLTSTECTTEKYVAAGSSSTSYLVYKLIGTWTCGSGSQMPKGGPYFTATQLNTVKAWIDQGANNN